MRTSQLGAATFLLQAIGVASRVMAKPTCLLDIDGTLAVTDHLYLLAFQDLMASHGVSDVVDAAWFKAHVAGKVDDAVFADVLPGTPSADELRAASAKKDALFCEHVAKTGATIVEGLDGFLGRCRAEGLTCVAVSNAQRGGCEAVLGQIKREFPENGAAISDLVVGAECARAKPFPDPYLEAMARLGVEPATCVVFEDSGTGIKAGVAAGVAVVGLTTSMTAEAMRSAGATATVADWTEVTPDFLRGLVAQQASGPSCPLL